MEELETENGIAETSGKRAQLISVIPSGARPSRYGNLSVNGVFLVS